MKSDNFKLLVRNLRTKKNEDLKIHTSARSVRYDKIGKSIRIPGESRLDQSEG